MNEKSPTPAAKPRVGLFVTCLVDLFRPSVGFAALALLEKAGCDVVVPQGQTCCGQPAHNSGDEHSARRIAKGVIAAFEDFDYVVAPSGSCTGMLKLRYPELFATDTKWRARAQALADRSHELLSFLTDVLDVSEFDATFAGSVTYHDTCSGLRELSVHEQPRLLLSKVAGLELKEMRDTNVCCGFGGTFAVKYPDISGRMVSDKMANVEAQSPEFLLGGDMGCLLNIAGRLARNDSRVRVYHAAEVLAGLAAETAAIGHADKAQSSGRRTP